MKKVDKQKFARIIELREKYSLTENQISIRLGISERTVRIYLRAWRTVTRPYFPGEAADVPSKDHPAADR